MWILSTYQHKGAMTWVQRRLSDFVRNSGISQPIFVNVLSSS